MSKNNIDPTKIFFFFCSKTKKVIVPYCDSCQPSETTWHQITLQCNKNDADTPSQLIKHVQIIHNCSCSSCEKDSLGLAKFPENNEDFYLQQSADAELLDALQSRRNESNSNHLESDRSKKIHSLLNHKLVTLLRNIQTNNSEHDKEQLFDLFNVIHEPLKHKINAKNIIDFIETLQNNKTDLDTRRLTEILLKFEYPKHYKMGNPTIVDMGDGAETKDPTIPESSSSLAVVDSGSELDKEDAAQKQRIPIAMWIQNSASSEATNPDEKQEHSNNDGNENSDELEKYGAPYELPLEMSSTEKDSTAASSISSDEHDRQEKRLSSSRDQKQQQSSEQDAHHHLHHSSHIHLHQHHVNDNIISSHGHLARGPHGALVIEPDRIHEEKLDVNAHELKPNHAGTLLSYHSHSGEGNAH